MSGELTWELLGYVTGGAGIALAAYFKLSSTFASRGQLKALADRVEALEKSYVSGQVLELELRPIRAEQSERKQTMDELRSAFGELTRTVHRMDKGIMALAIHFKVELPESIDG